MILWPRILFFQASPYFHRVTLFAKIFQFQMLIDWLLGYGDVILLQALKQPSVVYFHIV